MSNFALSTQTQYTLSSAAVLPGSKHKTNHHGKEEKENGEKRKLEKLAWYMMPARAIQNLRSSTWTLIFMALISSRVP